MIEKGKYESAGQKSFQERRNIYTDYISPACATPAQISCLMGLIEQYRFRDGSSVHRIVETGVNIGLTDYFMLKAGAGKDFRLYGIEINPDNEMGKVVKNESSEKEISNWVYCPGKTVYNIEEILENERPIDLVFIDGAHAHPYPLIDILFLFPFMRKDALIILHDVEVYLADGEMGNCFLYSAWGGEKYLNWNLEGTQTEYMGIIELPEDLSAVNQWLLSVAGLPIDIPLYHYTSEEQRRAGDNLGITEKHINQIRTFVERYYEKDFAKKLITTLVETIRNYRAHEIYLYHEKRIRSYFFNEVQHLRELFYEEGFANRYLFPWNDIKQKVLIEGAHIVIYGYGNVGRAFEGIIKRVQICHLDFIIDRNADKIVLSNMPIYTPDEAIKFIDNQVIVLAAEKEETAESMRCNLRNNGVSDEQIIWRKPF